MNEELARIWDGVAHVAQARVAVLERAVEALRAGADDGPARCVAASEECHKLVGSLDSYGLHGGSALALRAADLFDLPAPPVPELAAVVARLRELVERPAG